jgi:NAD(P)-dependent dehydrogenase (short-subunit alcohol dehydrogenase family)
MNETADPMALRRPGESPPPTGDGTMPHPEIETDTMTTTGTATQPLLGKVALVTGAGRGIGRAIAVALAEAGADVALNYSRSRDQAERAADDIRALGRRAACFQANVAEDGENRIMGRQIMDDLGLVQIVVNNAGITRDASFKKLGKEDWNEVLAVNLSGPALICHMMLPRMLESGWGRIINITSIIGQMGNFGQTNYAAAKGGLVAFTKSLARETARKGVTCNCVAPGFIKTDMTGAVPEAALDQVAASTPAGRLGEPEEIAHAVTFLAHPRAAFVTGEVLSVNGGLYM